MSVLNEQEKAYGPGKKLIVYKQCEWCGKKFYIRHPSVWRYKDTFKKKMYYFCSWGCLNHARQNTSIKATDTGMITYGKIKGTWKRTEEENDTCTT